MHAWPQHWRPLYPLWRARCRRAGFAAWRFVYHIAIACPNTLVEELEKDDAERRFSDRHRHASAARARAHRKRRGYSGLSRGPRDRAQAVERSPRDRARLRAALQAPLL